MIRWERELYCRRCALTESAVGDEGALPFALPGAEPVWVPDRVCDVRHIRIEVGLDFADKRVDGVCMTTLAVLNAGPTRVRLDAGEMVIHAVTLLDGDPVPYTHDGHTLEVDLGDRQEDEEVQLLVRYSARPRRGLYFIAPDSAYPERPTQAWTQGQDEDNRYWFPCFDHPHEKSTSEVLVTIPAHMTALSNGYLVNERVDEKAGTRTLHYRQEIPHASYLVTLVAGEFDVMEDAVEGVPLRYYVPHHRKDDAVRTFANTPQMVRLFTELTGRQYPWDRYSQVAVAEFIFGGMENTSATTLTDQTLHDARAHLDYSSEPLVAHELAHQWFGDLLTCRTWSEGWLNEGFATYFELLWKEHSAGRDEADYDRLGDMEAYFDEAAHRYRRPIVTNVFHEPIDVFDRHLYEKGGTVLHMLRSELGDTRFWKAVRLYVARHQGSSVETRDLARAVEDATGYNGDRFFDQWVQKSGHPTLKIEYGWDGDRHLASLKITQTQAPAPGSPDEKKGDAPPLFELPLTARFVVGGQARDLPVRVKQREETFLFAFDEPPTQAIVDVGNQFLKTTDEKKPSPLWREQLARAEHGIDRVLAARALGKDEPTAENVAALQRALREDRLWAVRGEAALALGALKTDEARRLVAAALADEAHPKARRLLVRALGNFRHDEQAADAVIGVLARDASYFVEAEAASSLAKTRSARAFAALEEARHRRTFLECVASACVGGMAELRDERGIEVALEMSRYGQPPPSRRAAIAALGKLGALFGTRRVAIREVIEELLEDPDFRARIAAVDALHDLGDAGAIGALAKAERRDLDGRVRRRAREVIRLLSDAATRDESLRGLKDTVEKLEKEQGELKERLARLEAHATPAAPASTGGSR